ncbi:MAG: hypothetical protein LBD79_08480 [Treponema sp.]|jgi:hypothetical protein|nr:hypothetical protein [Treponema sp.]
MKTSFLVWTILFPAFLYSAGSCSNAPLLEQTFISNASMEAPAFIACKAVSPLEIEFEFTTPVKLVSLNFDRPVEVESIIDGSQVKVTLKKRLAEGEAVTADILVEDEYRNTLNVLAPFTARNNRIPSIQLTEIRTEYSKPKVEFVEMKTLSRGNLGALRLFIASNGIDSPMFVFPSVEVQAGEYIVVHLRSIEEGLVNETGANLSVSAGTEAAPSGRDFWVPGSKKLLRKTDAVFLMDQDDKVLDALMLHKESDTVWKDGLAQAAELLGKQRAWRVASGTTPQPSDALLSDAATLTRTCSRNESIPDSDSTADWFITATSKATPGRLNTDKRYVAK